LAPELDQSKSALAQQKDAIAEARKALEPLRTQVSLHRDRVLSADAAVKRHAELISSWNDEMKEIEDSTLTTAQRRKKELEKEKIKLVATNNQLISERSDEMRSHEDAINLFNEEAKKLDNSIVEWNEKNKKLVSDSEKIIELREDYATDCSNRKYREEDEAEIKIGK